MRYLLLLTHDPDAWPDPQQAPSTRDPKTRTVAEREIYDDWGAYTAALHQAGVLIDGAALHVAGSATTVQVRQGRRLLTDGPFVETKEELFGYYLLDVADLDEALAWAAWVPSVRTGSVEVRPVQPDSHTAAVLAAMGAADDR